MPSIRLLIPFLVVFFGFFVGTSSFADPPTSVTILVTLHTPLPKQVEASLNGWGKLTLNPGPPVTATLKQEWNTDPLREWLEQEKWRLEPEVLATVEGALRRAENKTGPVEISEISKLMEIYNQPGPWRAVHVKEGQELLFPARVDREAVMRLHTGAFGEFQPFIPLLNEATDRPVHDLERPSKSRDRIFFPNGKDGIGIPAIAVSHDLLRRPVIVLLNDWQDYAVGRIPSLPLYSVDKDKLAETNQKETANHFQLGDLLSRRTPLQYRSRLQDYLYTSHSDGLIRIGDLAKKMDARRLLPSPAICKIIAELN